MEKLLPEELADRVGRLERECLDLRRANRHMKQFGGLTAVVAVQMTMEGSRHPQIVLTVNMENQVALSLLDSDHRPRIFLGLEPDGSPRLRLQDKDGNSLFQAPMEPNPTLPSLLKP